LNGPVFRIALLGNFTTEYIGMALREECVRAGICPEIYNAPYNQYIQQIMDPDSEFYAFGPDLSILLLDSRILLAKEFLLPEDIGGIGENGAKPLEDTAAALADLLNTIRRYSRTKIVVNNFHKPYHVPLGILDNRLGYGLKRRITLMNLELEKAALGMEDVYVFDFDGFCSMIGQKDMRDSKMQYLAGCTMSLAASKRLAGEYMRYILPFLSMNKKCLVLDLDNTLWGGIAAEDGLDGVCLDVTGKGRCYYDFQQEVLNLYRKGIFIAAASRNNPEDALEIINKHPHMLLRQKHFAAMRINWNDKAANLKEIASELNIGIDSLVFFDDNPVERELVKRMLPEVTVVDVPSDAAGYCDALRALPLFETLQITEEDRRRSKMAAQNRERAQYLAQTGNLEDYLEGLATVIEVVPANDFMLPRVSQLTLKTNQFNMTTKRYLLSQLRKMIDEGGHCILGCSVTDRFGDNGITGCCIAKLKESTAWLDTFLLSCRVLGRQVEFAFLGEAVRYLREKMNIRQIYAEYIPTAKNRANAGFYEKAGFRPVSSDEGHTVFVLDPGQEILQTRHIRIRTGEG
jgi:FkbH-like protein